MDRKAAALVVTGFVLIVMADCACRFIEDAARRPVGCERKEVTER